MTASKLSLCYYSKNCLAGEVERVPLSLVNIDNLSTVVSVLIGSKINFGREGGCRYWSKKVRWSWKIKSADED